MKVITIDCTSLIVQLSNRFIFFFYPSEDKTRGYQFINYTDQLYFE